jgi:hypothetical protein
LLAESGADASVTLIVAPQFFATVGRRQSRRSAQYRCGAAAAGWKEPNRSRARRT